MTPDPEDWRERATALKARTGCYYADCLRALMASAWDEDRAVDWLRTHMRM